GGVACRPRRQALRRSATADSGCIGRGEGRRRSRRDRGTDDRAHRGRAGRLGLGESARYPAMMLRYVIKRLLYMIPTLFGMSIIAFMIIQLPPGDFVTSLVARMTDSGQTF